MKKYHVVYKYAAIEAYDVKNLGVVEADNEEDAIILAATKYVDQNGWDKKYISWIKDFSKATEIS